MPYLFLYAMPDSFMFRFLFIAVTVTIAVTIAITITVTITVAFPRISHSIQHHGHILQLVLSVQVLQFRQLPTVHHSGTDNVNSQVDYPVHNRSISHYPCRNIIYNDVVVAFTQFLNQQVQPVAHQQFCRVRRYWSCKNHIQLAVFLTLPDNVIHVVYPCGYPRPPESPSCSSAQCSWQDCSTQTSFRHPDSTK